MPIRLFSFLFSIFLLGSFTSVSACDMTLHSVLVVADDKESIFAKKVIEKAGCKLVKIDYKEAVTLDRRLDMLENGQIDLIIGMNQRPERDEYALFSVPFAEERVRLWSRKGEVEQYANMTLKELTDKGVTIFGPDAGWYGPDYKALVASNNPQITLYKDFKRALLLLSRGRNDLILGSENFIQYMKPEFKEATEMLPQVIHTDLLRFMYSKKTVSPEVVKYIDAVIEAELAESKLLFSVDSTD